MAIDPNNGNGYGRSGLDATGCGATGADATHVPEFFRQSVMDSGKACEHLGAALEVVIEYYTQKQAEVRGRGTKATYKKARRLANQAAARVRDLEDKIQSYTDEAKNAEDEQAAAEVRQKADAASGELADAQKAAIEESGKAKKNREAAGKARKRLNVFRAITANATLLAHRCAAGVALAAQPIEERSLRPMTTGFVSILKLFDARYQPWARFAPLEPKLVETCNTRLGEFKTSVRSLCHALQAAEQKCSPGYGLLEWNGAARKAVECFKMFREGLKDRSCDSCVGDITIREKSDCLVEEGRKLVEETGRHAEGCDLPKMRKVIEGTYRTLNTLQLTCEEIFCRIDFLACLHQAEPIPCEAQTFLLRGCRYTADIYRMVVEFKPEEENCVEQMWHAWACIGEETELLRDEFRRWEQGQLCGTPECCRIATEKLMSCTKGAEAILANFAKDRDWAAACKSIQVLIECVNTEIVRITGQVAHAERFDPRRLDAFWRPILQVYRLCAATPPSAAVPSPAPAPVVTTPVWAPTDQQWVMLDTVAQAIGRLVPREQQRCIVRLVHQIEQQRVQSQSARSANECLAAQQRWDVIVKTLSLACSLALGQVTREIQGQIYDQLYQLAQLGGPTKCPNGTVPVLATPNGVSTATAKGGAAR